MTDTERITALEARVASLLADNAALGDDLAAVRAGLATLVARIGPFQFDFWRFGTNPEGQRWGMTMGRYGIMTKAQSELPAGQGAAFSVGTISDRYGVYVEVEQIACPDHPTIGVFSSVTQANPVQKNVAFAADAASSPHGNITLQSLQGQGIEVAGADRFDIGRVDDHKKLWP